MTASTSPLFSGGQAPEDKNAFRFPASYAQQRLWFIDQMEPGLSTYNVPVALRVEGKLDASSLKKTFQEMVNRHESLRTTFSGEEDEPRQVIWETLELDAPTIDLRSLPKMEREPEARKLAEQEALLPFDLVSGPLLRVKLLQLDEQDHVLLVTVHHIVFDGWSAAILMREVSALYRAFSTEQPSGLPALALQYVDYTAWQREWLKGEALNRQIEYWRRQLAGVSPLELPTDRPRPAVFSYRGGAETFTIPASIVDKLKDLGRQQGATLYITLMAAFQTLLYRYTGQQDVTVGSPIAGRRRQEMEGLIGFFVNTLVLRAYVSPDATFTQLLQQVKETTLQAFANQDAPFEKLVEILQPERDLGRTPLFQAMLVLQNVPPGDLELPSAKLSPFNTGSQTAKFDLMFILAENNSGLQGSVGYGSDLFDAATIQRMIGHFQKLLAGIAAGPHSRVAELPLLSDDEKRTIERWNRTAQPYPLDCCVHWLFEQQVLRTPREIAVAYESEELTYEELNNRSNQMARYLREHGVGADDRVGICMNRSLGMIVGLMGILKAGAAYIPLDPAYPQARLKYMLENAGIRVLLTETETKDLLPEHSAKAVILDTVWHEIAGNPTHSPAVEVLPENIAYVIYTSGSTGRPKGVALPHRALSNLIHWQIRNFEFVLRNTLQFTSLSFDVSVQEIFSTLAAGGLLHLVDDDVRRDIPQLRNVIARKNIERIFLPYVALDHLSKAYLEESSPECPLREIITAGEQLQITPAIQALFERTQDAVLANHYGPSETHVASSYTLKGDAANWPKLPPVGHAIANSQLHVLNACLEPAPLGVAGELYISGSGVARGYLNNPDLTAERFLPNPFSHKAGDRLYKTGDIVRWNKDGELEFLGRIDGQVKIRGYRIELGEIESELRQHPAVEQAVVVVHQDESQRKRLIGYIVTRYKIATDELRDYLQSKLPEYMTPSVFVVLESIPLTPSGKTDRRALPPPTPETGPQSEDTYVAPQSLTEELLAQIWTTVLDRTRIGINDDFFALGGHSLLATQVASRIRNIFRVDVPLRRVFEAPTVAKLARVIDRLTQAREDQDEPEIRKTEAALLPLSYAQQRLWFIEELTPGRTVYHIPVAVRIQGSLDLQALERVFNAIVHRHESLRTHFGVVDGEPHQIIEPPSSLRLPVLDLNSIAEDERENEALRITLEEIQTPFDLKQGPLFRVKLLGLAEDDFVLVAAMHHIVSDGWSLGVLMREVSALYEAFSAGRPSPLPELPVQYADYAAWQRKWLQGKVLEKQISYWKQQLAEAETLDLPMDKAKARPALASNRGAAEIVALTPEVTEGLRKVGRRHGTTMYMTVLAAFQVLLARYSGQRDIAVGSPVAGRRRSELEGLIGFFINTLVLRSRISGGMTFSQLLGQVRETTLQAYAHQDVPFEKLVEVLQPERDLSRTPLFQVMFVLQNAPQSGLTLGKAKLASFPLGGNTAKFDLTLNLGEVESGLQGGLNYNTDLFTEAGAKRMLGHWHGLLSSLIAEPERPIGELSILNQEEGTQLLLEWNHTAADYPQRCVHELFAEQAARTPHATAVEFEGRTMSYAELNRCANQLAHHLRRLEVGPEVRVGICLERSFEMVVGLLGILKAGGAFLPMDPSYPSERLEYVLQDGQVPVLLTQERFLSRFENTPVRVLALDAAEDTLAEESGENPANTAGVQNLVYVIYTSGSTGRPKGAMNVHGGLSNRLLWMQQHYGLNAADRILQKTAFTFDVSVWEFFAPLIAGARLVMARPGGHQDPEYLSAVIRESQTTIAHFVPSMLSVWLEEKTAGSCASLQRVICSGEALSLETQEEFRSKLEAELHNLYGPTEASIEVTFWHCREDRDLSFVPIGKPIANTGVYVLDADGQPVPVNVKGELYLGGVGLARGYLNQPELTAEKFIPNSFSGVSGARLYRTGDQVRWHADGVLEFLGRLDHQVKLRGYRIELGEIESALREQDGVKEAAVLLREDHEDKRLVAYVVMKDGKTTEALREGLRQRLPEHIVPTGWVELEQLPLTASGKLDRRALPAPGRESRRNYIAPRNEKEERLAEIWSQVLRVERIGVEDNFFDLGGHSLLAVRLCAAIRNRMNCDLSLIDVFQYPTIAKMAQQTETPAADSRLQILVPINPLTSGTPFFCIHAIGGHVLSYSQLARELGQDLPFYGLQSPPSGSSYGPLETVEQMASVYNKEIRRIQAHGPYLLGGWSMGGLVAFEMARQLRAQGETIALLALFDTYPPSGNRSRHVPADSPEMLALFALEMARSIGQDASALQSQFAELTLEEQQKLVMDELIRAEVIARDHAETEFNRMLNLYMRNLLAMQLYTPSTQEQNILLFKAAEGENPRAIAEEWKKLSGGRVELHLLPGNHYTILQRPALIDLASILKSRIERGT
jgi:amino acid adenylation domain-containing protein